MINIFRRSLTVHTIMLLAGGLVVAFSLSTLLYSRDRLEALIDLGLRNTALSIMHVAHTVSSAEPEERNAVINSLRDPRIQTSITDQPLFENERHWDAYQDAFLKYLQSEAHQSELPSLRFRLVDQNGTFTGNTDKSSISNIFLGLLKSFYGLPTKMSAQVAIELNDRRWINIQTQLPETPTELWSPSLLPAGMLTIVIILASSLAVRRMLQPLHDVSEAARRFTRDINAPPMKSGGSSEAQSVADAFNEMQHQIRGMVRSRTEMMGAISHDLRTPLALLKLRTETLPPSLDRDRLIDTVSKMDAIIGATLDFAKQTFDMEERSLIDGNSLIQAICDDMSEAGHKITLDETASRFIVEGQPIALRRAITNLIENASKYGDYVQVKLEVGDSHTVIEINDDGPGISEKDMKRVFEPFYRCDEARSTEHSGTGLGLGLAKTVIEAHGGEIQLRNLNEGGLSVRVTLGLHKAQ